MSQAPGAPPPQIVIPGQGWVDVASRVIVQVGFPVVVAGVLLWFLLTRFTDNMSAITNRMERNASAVEAFTNELKAHTTELKAQTIFLRDQGQLIAQIAADAKKLVAIREDELTYTKQIADSVKHPK